MGKKSFLITLLVIFIILFTTSLLARSQINKSLNEQLEIGQAFNLINKEMYREAKEILLKYEENENYKYSSTYNANMAFLELKLKGEESEIKKYLMNAYNSNPFLLEDEGFLSIFKNYLNGENDEKK